MKTAETITVAEIRTLRTEAFSAGDAEAVEWCDVALASNELNNADGEPLFSPRGELTTRMQARHVVATIINDAAAANNDE